MPGHRPAAPADRRDGFGPSQVAGGIGVGLFILGLSMPFTSSNAWSTQTAWSIFVVLAAAVAAAASFAAPMGPDGVATSGRRWMVGAAATGGVFGYWLLMVLPSVSSNSGFILTAATAASVAAAWFSPARPR